MEYKDNMKETWEIIKEITGKTEMINNNLPEKRIANRKNILEKKEKANKLNNFFVKIGPKLAKKIQPSKYYFESFIDSVNTKQFGFRNSHQTKHTITELVDKLLSQF